MILQTWTTACGLWARCGGEDCQEVLHFQYPDDTVTCDACGSVCDLTGAIMEYVTLVMRVGSHIQVGDVTLNELAEKGWVVDKMDVASDPLTIPNLMAVYLLRRLVANRRFINDLEAKAVLAAAGE